MGIDVAALRFLLDSRLRFGPFGNTLQIGRQGIHLWDKQSDLATQILKLSGLGENVDAMTGSQSVADELLRNLGASDVSTMDASSYEGASIVHDLNEPVPADLYGKFDTIYDGGSLEHIFNVPVVVVNYLKMLSVGGHVMIATVANNYLGHGFYQFSPEWAFRTFSGEWGCRVKSCYLVSNKDQVELIPAMDPEKERKRVEMFTTPAPTYLMIAIEKISVSSYSTFPQQSDYAATWKVSSGEIARKDA